MAIQVALNYLTHYEYDHLVAFLARIDRRRRRTIDLLADAQTYSVRADGKLLTCEPAVSLPMAQRYFLF